MEEMFEMKKVVKLFALVMAMIFALAAFAACGNSGSNEAPANAESQAGDASAQAEPAQKAEVKAGLICLHDENSTYDLNFIEGFKQACETMGLVEGDTYLIKTNIPEGQECYDAASELVDAGCNFIFADSFGHEDFMIEAAKENPDVTFCHATGTKAHTENLDNYHNAFAEIFNGRYLAGVAAGLKLNEMIEAGDISENEAVMGYIGAFTYAEVISGYTSYFLGARSVCPSATMKVTFTGSWYDEALEKEAANNLIAGGCVLISQHADSMGAPTACEAAGVPNVSYNGSTISVAENTYIVSSRINWAPYYEYVIGCITDGLPIDTDWTGTIDTQSVLLTEVNEKVAADGTQAKIDEVKEKLINGELHAFDTSTFTVDGKEVTSYLADVDSDENMEGDTEVVSDGVFHESEYRSAPYFDLTIDGIELLDTSF